MQFIGTTNLDNLSRQQAREKLILMQNFDENSTIQVTDCISSGITPQRLEAPLRVNNCKTRLAAQKFEGEITHYFFCLNLNESNQIDRPYFVRVIHNEKEIALRKIKKKLHKNLLKMNLLEVIVHAHP